MQNLLERLELDPIASAVVDQDETTAAVELLFPPVGPVALAKVLVD